MASSRSLSTESAVPLRLERIPRASGLGDGDERSSGWDVGERPTNRTAHLFYPTYEFAPAHGRSEDLVQSRPPVLDKEEALERKRERDQSGWASSRKEVYKPLGPPVELPLLGQHLRKRPQVQAQYRKPRVVMPQEGDKKQELTTQVIKPLMVDVTVEEESVRFARSH